MTIKVIGAGHGRTGTLSAKVALEQLGFGPCYHMYELMSYPERVPHWQNAFAKKPVDWDALFEGYGSTVDAPGNFFWKEMMEAYPEARVLLTTRPSDQWYESALKTIYTASPNAWQKFQILLRLPFNERLRKVMPVFKMVDHVWDVVFEGRFGERDFAIAKFEEMNNEVIETVPADKLLVYEVKDGWDPLCKFLNVPVPEGPFPKTNNQARFHEKLDGIRKGRMPLEGGIA
jgi:hypothetical protein